MFIHHGQGIDITNAGPTFESSAILYEDNLSTDPEL